MAGGDAIQLVRFSLIQASFLRCISAREGNIAASLS
jgi:hypothetical protein